MCIGCQVALTLLNHKTNSLHHTFSHLSMHSPSAPSLEPITAKPVDEKEVKKEGTKPTADLVVEEAPAENLEDKKERTHIAAEEPNDQSTQPSKKKGLSLKKKFLRAKLSSSPSLKESIPEKIEKKEMAHKLRSVKA